MPDSPKKYDAIIIGGGPAGMMAAINLAENGYNVIIAEKNKILGKKLRITGKGRCNITNSCEKNGLSDKIVSGARFLQSSFSKFSNLDLIDYLNREGLPTVTERGGRVFPESQKAYDVAEFFVKKLKDLKVKVLYDFEVRKLLADNSKINGVEGILCGKKFSVLSDAVLIATGGITYKGTGSTGDGYYLAVSCGHSVVSPGPSLVALKCLENRVCASLKGLTLKNVSIRLKKANRTVFEDFGEMMFTGSGITGPLVLSMSRFYIANALDGSDPINSLRDLDGFFRSAAEIYTSLNKDRSFTVSIDLKPALDPDSLDDRIVRDFSKYKAKSVKNAFTDLLPSSIIMPVIEESGIDPFKKCSQITASERKRLAFAIKNFNLTPLEPDDPDHAVVTQGGVDLNGVNPSTLQSKFMEGLFFAGEVLNADGLTGGYNLTIAFSTGFAAGTGIRKYLSGK